MIDSTYILIEIGERCGIGGESLIHLSQPISRCDLPETIQIHNVESTAACCEQQGRNTSEGKLT